MKIYQKCNHTCHKNVVYMCPGLTFPVSSYVIKSNLMGYGTSLRYSNEAEKWAHENNIKSTEKYTCQRIFGSLKKFTIIGIR